MVLDIRGELDIEVDGEPIHVMAKGDHMVLTLERLGTIVLAARTLSRVPKIINRKLSLSQGMTFCPAITVKVGQDTVLSITSRSGFLSSLLRYRLVVDNKKLWLRHSFQLVRLYFQ
ncbi:hypothetical protein MD588_16370 [Photobacterium sp. SDRW27]|uniref:hypothetical protein n=1 Tax=Photobacterium obscurum TaxID=2829490 RepID=UPI002244A060|nr:hypothetical protein [Photobacterium obscurum]MCW8330386.1 hypothetical protein [Photobacterium obscurum]